MVKERFFYDIEMHIFEKIFLSLLVLLLCILFLLKPMQTHINFPILEKQRMQIRASAKHAEDRKVPDEK